MFHTPNINLTEVQSKCLDIRLITHNTLGKKEEELKHLKEDYRNAKKTITTKFK